MSPSPGPRYHNGQHGLQPRAPNTREPRVNTLLHFIQGCQPFCIGFKVLYYLSHTQSYRYNQ